MGACLLAVSLVLAMAGGAPLAAAQTRTEAVRAALATNPEVEVVAANREAVEQELRQARALYLPQVDLRAAVGPEYTDSPGTRDRLTDGDTTLLRSEAQLTLSQMLFDGFATRSEVRRQLARVDSAAYRVAEAAEFIALDAIEAYLDVLRNEQLVALAEENIGSHEGILGQVSRLEREGAGGIADVRQAEARLAAAQANLAQAEGNLRDARATFRRVVGAPPVDPVQPRPPVDAVPEAVEAATLLAAEYSPTVQIVRADIDVARAELQGAQADYYPRLDVELGATAGDNIDGVEGRDVGASALLVMRYNLFRGGADVAREREAFARMREARRQLDAARRTAEEEAQLSYSALTTARARAAALRNQAEANVRTREAYGSQFELGQRSLLDLLDAENELFVSRSSLVTAEQTEAFAVYRVLAVIGTLLGTLDIERPPAAINIHRRAPEPLDAPLPEEVPAVVVPPARSSALEAPARRPQRPVATAAARGGGPVPVPRPVLKSRAAIPAAAAPAASPGVGEVLTAGRIGTVAARLTPVGLGGPAVGAEDR
ncbi:MAG TPA: TolC family outer membrane protein [Geminicoccaceae bacterium]|nr:TolC family outer membrane protein [Geminicoccaceae bacterium]